jgi:hypothetical protein
VGVRCRKPKGMRPHRRPWYRWEDNIEMNLKTLDGKAWIGLIWIKRGRSGRLLMITVPAMNFLIL